MRRYPGARLTIVDEGPRLLVSWIAGDSDTFHTLRVAFRGHFPGRDAIWRPDESGWEVRGHLRHRLECWAYEVAGPAGVVWERAEAYDHNEVRVPASIDAAYATLCLRPNAPSELTEHVYRWWARRCHPDVGGSHEAAVALNGALETIRNHAPSQGAR